jgi:hypothetical protein
VIDADGDGHLDRACGGGDDCDDRDATMYLGAPELCDGKDNDCNALVDDYAVVARTAPFTHEGNTGYVGAGTMIADQLVATTTSWGPFGFRVYGAVHDPSGAAVVPDKLIVTTPGWTATGMANPGRLLGLRGGPTHGVLLWDRWPGGTYPVRTATLIKPDLGVVGDVTLVPQQQQTGDADAVWTGSSFLVAWVKLGSGSGFTGYGEFAFVRPDGALDGAIRVLPTADGTGRLGTFTSGMRVASLGSTYAIAYDGPSPTTEVILIGASGARIGAPISLGNGTLRAIGATRDAFVVLTTYTGTSKLQTILPSGALGREIVLSGIANVLQADAQPFGEGAAFLVRVDGGLRFVYARGVLASAPEITTPWAPAAVDPNKDFVTLGASPKRLGLFDWTAAVDGKLHVFTAGCR